MVTIYATIDVDDFLAEIGVVSRDDLPSNARATLANRRTISFDVEVEQGEIDENASEPDPEYLTLDAADLRDAVRALAAGDLTMAGIMFGRALRDDPEAANSVENVLREVRAARAAPRLAVAA